MGARMKGDRAMFRALVTNPPWPGDGYGARSSVRWPHKRKDKKLEYPIFLSYEDHCVVRDQIEGLVMTLILELRRTSLAPKLHRFGSGRVEL